MAVALVTIDHAPPNPQLHLLVNPCIHWLLGLTSELGLVWVDYLHLGQLVD